MSKEKKTIKETEEEKTPEEIQAEKLESKDFNFVLTKLKKKLLNNNRNLKNQFINQEILKNEIKLNHSGYYPTVSLNSGISMNRMSMKYPDIPLNSSK